MEKLKQVSIISTSDRKCLVKDIKNKLNKLLGEDVDTQILDYKYFKDGSPDIILPKSIRGKDAYVLSDVYSDSLGANGLISSINDRYMYSRLIQRIAHVFGAKSVNAIYPAFPYARDDKLDNMGTGSHMKRKPNAASMIVQDSYASDLGYVLTLDIHNLATISSPVNNGKTRFVSLAPAWMIQELISNESLDLKNVILSGTDEGSVKKIDAICKDLKTDKLVSIKQKDYSKSQTVDNIQVYGEANWKDVILYDDILDTGGTMLKCLKQISKKSPKSVNLLISHALFNGDSLEKLLQAHKNGLFNKLYISNSVLRERLNKFFECKGYPSFIEHIDISNIISHAISSIVQEKDIDYNNNSII